MLTSCENTNTMATVCTDLDVELVEFNGETDHVHLLVHYPPTLAISMPGAAAERPHGLRGASRIHRPPCPRPYARTPLVASYFAVSCVGASLSIIKQYIDGQARPL